MIGLNTPDALLINHTFYHACSWPIQTKTLSVLGYLKYHKLDNVRQITKELKIYAANFHLFHFV
jgi:hypothetical protein